MVEQQNITDFTGTDGMEDIPLPESLVSDVLQQTDNCADFAADMLDSIDEFEEIRENLIRDGTIKKVNPETNSYDSICGVDGSYDVIEGSGVSIGLCSAVRVGSKLGHNVRVFPTPDSPNIGVACQGIGTMLEMKSVVESTEDLVIVDGSFVSVLVNLNQLLGKWSDSRENQDGMWEVIEDMVQDLYGRQNYLYDALTEQRVVASPKRSSSSYFLEQRDEYSEYSSRFSDRAFFSQVLNAGEYVSITRREIDHSESGTNYARGATRIVDRDEAEKIEQFYDHRGFKILFYKPEPWSRAYRLEIPRSNQITDYEKALSTFGDEIVDPTLLEPYPQWLADTMCKKIIETSGAVKEGIQNRLASEGYDPEDVNALLRGHRTELL